MKPVLMEIVEKHINMDDDDYKVDWMGYPITEDNPLTYHHIVKKADGGEMTVDNGAPLTQDAHNELNIIEQKFPNIYIELNNLFTWLKQKGIPPNEEYWHKLRQILSKMKTQPIEEYWLRQIPSNTETKQIKNIKIYRRII